MYLRDLDACCLGEKDVEFVGIFHNSCALAFTVEKRPQGYPKAHPFNFTIGTRTDSTGVRFGQIDQNGLH
ncbi:hypothetical protein D9M71_817010 [compost metagenome]